MNIVLSSTVLASAFAPAFSFSYLDSLGGGNPVSAAPAAAAAPSNGASYLDALNGPAPTDTKDYSPFDNWTEEDAAPAAAAPAAAAPAAAASEPYASGFAPVEGDVATTSAGYLESVHIAGEIHGPGLMTHVDTLNTGTGLVGGAGIHTYAGDLPVGNAVVGGAGIHTYTDGLSPSSFGSSASFTGESSTDGVSFTLETGDISGLVQDLSAGGTLRLSGSIDSISYN